MDAAFAGELIGIALRTLAFPILLGKILVWIGLAPKVSFILRYVVYAILAWPLMLFVTYRNVEGLGNIILDIVFLLLWMVIGLIRRNIKSKSEITTVRE